MPTITSKTYSLDKELYAVVYDYDEEVENKVGGTLFFDKCTVSAVNKIAQLVGEDSLDEFDATVEKLKVKLVTDGPGNKSAMAKLKRRLKKGEEPIGTFTVTEGEVGAKASVVDDRYRDRYKKVSKGGVHCGDWLAQELEGVFTTRKKGDKRDSFDWKAFRGCLKVNDIDMSGKWAKLPESGQKGWVGRYRMNGRQKLEQKVLQEGKLLLAIGDETVVETPPIEWLNRMLNKYPSVKDLKWQEGSKGKVEYL